MNGPGWQLIVTEQRTAIGTREGMETHTQALIRNKFFYKLKLN